MKTPVADRIHLQVFPNPFSEQLSFTFEIPETQNVQLTIFNPLGQAIETVWNAPLPNGEHRLIWKTKPGLLPSGLYYYRLRIGNRFVARPVVLK